MTVDLWRRTLSSSLTYSENGISNPGNQQVNGKDESAVKIAKRLMCKKHGYPHWPVSDTASFQKHPDLRSDLHRCTRTLLLTRSNLLKLRTASLEPSDKTLLEHNQNTQTKYYNRRDLPVLSEDDVRMRPYKKGDRVWEKGVINHLLDERSYEVQTPSGTCRHHSQKLTESVEHTTNGQPPPTPTDTLFATWHGKNTKNSTISNGRIIILSCR